MTTAATEQAADSERDLSAIRFYKTVVIAMNSQAAGMSTGAGKLMKLEGKDDIIVKFLRYRVATIDRYSYHKYVWYM